MAVTDEIIRLYEDRGRLEFAGMSIAESALEAAHLAERSRATDSLVIAALLHDIGYLVDDAALDPSRGHEQIGAAWLTQYFGPAITEPIRLHVKAKRYLCTQASHYRTRLSAEASRSLEAQGGVMSPSEMATFVRKRYFLEALKLRRWVDSARAPGLRLPGFEHYRPRLEAAAAPAVTVA